MPTYYVTLHRPTLDAATPEEAAQKCLTDPLDPDDVVYVKDIPPDGSMFVVPGAVAVLGGAWPQPDEIYLGPSLVPQLKKGK